MQINMCGNISVQGHNDNNRMTDGEIYDATLGRSLT